MIRQADIAVLYLMVAHTNPVLHMFIRMTAITQKMLHRPSSHLSRKMHSDSRSCSFRPFIQDYLEERNKDNVRRSDMTRERQLSLAKVMFLMSRLAVFLSDWLGKSRAYVRCWRPQVWSAGSPRRSPGDSASSVRWRDEFTLLWLGLEGFCLAWSSERRVFLFQYMR